jgi:two-component system alkaline phosphatase synthesis response regulator PhoP
MLHTLARHADRVLSTSIAGQVWGYDYHDDLRVVDAVIKRLRAKLREAAPDAEWIVTIRSVGYKLTQ